MIIGDNMAIIEYHVNGKIIRVSDEVDEKETGIALIKKEEEEKVLRLDKKDYNEETLVDIYGEKNES